MDPPSLPVPTNTANVLPSVFPSSLLTLIQNYTKISPTKTVFTYLSEDGESILASVTYEELDRITTSLAIQLLQIPIESTDTSTSSSTTTSTTSTIRKKTLQKGDRVLLVYLPSLDFIITFIACLRAGIVAVPVYPPDPRNLKVNIALFTSIATSSGAKLALTHQAYTSVVSLAKLKDSALRVFTYFSSSNRNTNTSTPEWPTLPWFTTTLSGTILELPSSSTSISLNNAIILDQTSMNDLAFLQYTSGSTSEPKGVMISHGNLAHNLYTIVQSLKASTSTIVVSWLPQYHDMGLIGSYLGVLACGGSGYYISPLSFIKRPIVWLQLISKYKGTHIQAPNFAYILVARKFKEYIHTLEQSPGQSRPKWLETFSLQSLQHCFNAAEPITGVALYDFIQTFVHYQFSIPSLAPGYGLAEHTVYVCDHGTYCIIAERASLESNISNTNNVISTKTTVKIIERLELTDLSIIPRHRLVPNKTTVILISCGPVSPYNRTTNKNKDVNVLIVNPETQEVLLEDNCIGEIWINSPSKAQGYYNRQEFTQEAFYAKLQIPKAKEMEIARNNNNAIESKEESKEDNVKNESKENEPVDQSNSLDNTTLKSKLSTKPPISSFTETYPFPSGLYNLSYLRTGDLGFIDNGELFITGRVKDLIILRGRNFYPQDIEQVVETSVSQIRPGCTAVFTLPGGNEEVILATELRPELNGETPENIVTSIRGVVMRDFGIRLTAIVLLKPHGIRKTTSGKVARAWNAKAYQSMELNDPNSPWSPSSGLVWLVAKDTVSVGDDDTDTYGLTETKGSISATTTVPVNTNNDQTISISNVPLFGTVEGPKLLAYLRKDIAQLLGIPLQAPETPVPTNATSPVQVPPLTAANLPINISLLNLGLDSLTLMQLQGKLQAEYNLKLKDEQMFNDETTIQWIVQHARELRGQEGTIHENGNTGSEIPSTIPGGSTNGNTLPNAVDNPITTNNSSSFEMETVPPGVEIADPAELMRMYQRNTSNGRKKGPSFMELNCPCFLWCCGK